MTTDPKAPRSRRELLRTIGRAAAAAGLAGAAAWLGICRGAPVGEPCHLLDRCAACGLFAGCTLPQAERARNQTRSPAP